MAQRYRVVIVGGGASGVLAALHVRAAGVDSFAVIEPGALGHGVAFGTVEPAHLLNVRAHAMSAYGDDPEHFAHWIAPTGASNKDFVQRVSYGAYLTEQAESAVTDVFATTADSLQPDDEGVDIMCADGRHLRAEHVALATGHGHNRTYESVLSASPRFHPDPFADVDIPSTDDVLILGTGLTAVDMVVLLAARSHRGRITMVSRRGLLPLPHKDVPPLPPIDPPTAETLGPLVREIREFAAHCGADWRAAVDALRPHTNTVWAKLSLADQRRFLRSFLRFWEAHRHRMPEVSADIMSQMREKDQLRVVAVRHPSFVIADEFIELRGGSVPVRFAQVVNCTGAATPAVQDPFSLPSRLVEEGIAERDPLGLGLVVRQNGMLSGQERITAIGSLRRGRLFWETIAIPEIRKQAARFAARVA
ncbi:MAG: NAD(P)-binding domain-containing protein [Corynebacteriales bacterium]|nr:NAD(P)-binding domain-containing protein [Mycobacteriales bacterium]